jgi:hypothetical protein
MRILGPLALRRNRELLSNVPLEVSHALDKFVDPTGSRAKPINL